jgi:hypothetical protein
MKKEVSINFYSPEKDDDEDDEIEMDMQEIT